MSDRERGLYQKFIVTRADGTSEPGQKHEECSYFTLDLVHDKHAAAALGAYAQSCRAEYPELAKDLDVLAGRLVEFWSEKSGPLGPCAHVYMTSGQKVDGGKDERVETCVKCGRPR